MDFVEDVMISSVLRVAAVLFIGSALLLSLNCTDENNPVEANNGRPEVTIVSLSANSSYLEGDTVFFTASAIDPEDGELADSFLVWISNQDGQFGIGQSLKTDSLSVNIHRITLTATDSKGLAGSDSVIVIIHSASDPVVSISSPSDNATVNCGDTITFVGFANDPEDGQLTGNSLVWTSDMDGEIGTGDSLLTDSLSVNSHVITLTATDSHNSIVTASVTIEVTCTFEKTFGGPAWDEGYAVRMTSDGSYVVTGSQSSFGNGYYDACLVKFDYAGNTVWEKTYGGATSDHGYSVSETAAGGYIIAGMTNSSGAGGYDVYLFKTDNAGNLAWESTFGGTGLDVGRSVCETSDGSYLIVGFTESSGAGKSDLYLVKVDNNGSLIWEKTFGGTSWDRGYSVCETSDGGYLLAGRAIPPDSTNYNVYLIKTDVNGNQLWGKYFLDQNSEGAYSAIETLDGGFIIAGDSYSFGLEQSDVYLIKTDNAGNLVWENKYGGSSSDYGYAVCEISGGGYVIAGYTESYGAGMADVYLIKTDNAGNLVWEKTFGGTGDDYGHAVCETPDGGYIITGATESYGVGVFNVYLIKTDSEGIVY